MSEKDRINVTGDYGCGDGEIGLRLSSFNPERGSRKTAYTNLKKDDVILLVKALLEAVGLPYTEQDFVLALQEELEAAYEAKPVTCQFHDLRDTLETMPDCRTKSLALTKLEECLFWSAAAMRGNKGAFEMIAKYDELDEVET